LLWLRLPHWLGRFWLGAEFARRVGELGLGIERLCYRLGIEVYHGVLVPLNQCEIRVGTRQLLHELIANLVRAGSGEAPFSGAQSHEHELVVFAALELEGSAVGAIGQDRIADVHQKQRFRQASAIARGNVTDELNEESLQIGHPDVP
jgi:hypothetical protein